MEETKAFRDSTEPVPTPPDAPNPNKEQPSPQAHGDNQAQSNDVPCLQDENWDLTQITGLAAVKMLIDCVQALADETGMVLPSPAISHPATPRAEPRLFITPPSTVMRNASAPISPNSPGSSIQTPVSAHSGAPSPMLMPSPEGLRDEIVPAVETCAATDIESAESRTRQQAVIARRFFLKTVPAFTLSEYLMRIHTYCAHSPAVYLAAAAYIHRLCIVERNVPATAKTVHRLCLAGIRVASKALEDNKWSQDRIAKVGGVSRRELRSLEINLCYLLDFELFVREEEMRRTMFILQRRAQLARLRVADMARAEKGVSSTASALKLATRLKEETCVP